MFLLLIFYNKMWPPRDISLLHQYIWADAGCGLKPESTSGHAHTSFTYINDQFYFCWNMSHFIFILFSIQKGMLKGYKDCLKFYCVVVFSSNKWKIGVWFSSFKLAFPGVKKHTVIISVRRYKNQTASRRYTHLVRWRHHSYIYNFFLWFLFII